MTYFKRINLLIVLFLLIFSSQIKANFILLPMDQNQRNHLRAYGVVFFVLTKEVKSNWLLNYRGGSFAFPYSKEFELQCKLKGVSFQIIADAQMKTILNEIADPQINQAAVKLEKAPKIAVYSPKTKQPWDDAVTMVLTYADIPYDVIYDDDVLENKLHLYDWLHLHHEDFTGQYGKFLRYQSQNWYKEEKREAQEIAAKWGFKKVSQLKLAVAKKIRDFVLGGGYLFAMCAAADTYDIALAAQGVDIVPREYDGDPIEPNAQTKIDYNKTFAFKDFSIVRNPWEYEYSSIDATTDYNRGRISERTDFFTLFEFSAKWDQIPTMLCQNHSNIIKGFFGQTTAFRKQYIKSNVLILGETKKMKNAKYIHGQVGKGMWTFYGGHDPEDYQHLVGEPPTDLNLYPNSAGYRLILNNILFPAAKKKKQKT